MALSEGQRLTIEVAEGGRIIGDGIRCGSRQLQMFDIV